MSESPAPGVQDRRVYLRHAAGIPGAMHGALAFLGVQAKLQLSCPATHSTYLVANLDPVTSKNDFLLVQGVVLLQDAFSKRYGFWLL